MSAIASSARRHDNVAAAPRESPRRWIEAGLATAAVVLVSIGFAGVGDAPDPHASELEIAHWFSSRRSDILLAAPFGYLGALAIVGLAVVVARNDHERRGPVVSRTLIVGSSLIAAYLACAQIAWSSSAYVIADSSPQATKALFALTIVSVPVLAVGLSLTAGAAAMQTLTRHWWWRAASTGVAAVSAVGVIAIADSGFLSPDVQQQTTANLLLVWLLVIAVAAVFPPDTSTNRTASNNLETTS